MKELDWIEKNSQKYDATEGELNGKKAFINHKIFKGVLPYRMINKLRSMSNDGIIKLDNGGWVSLKFSSQKGNNNSEIYINRVICE